MSSIYELLCSLPLFRGVSENAIREVAGSTKFHFLKYPDSETIVSAGDPCSHLAFVISGSVRTELSNSNGRFIVRQTLTAPAVLAPDFLFGRRTQYPATVIAIGEVSIIKISKADYMRILKTDEIFVFNYLNTLSVNAQKAVEGIISLTDGSLEKRVAFWVSTLTRPEASDIVLECRTRDLCNLFAVPRSIFEGTMHNMGRRGLLTYTPRQIGILDRRGIVDLLDDDNEME